MKNLIALLMIPFMLVSCSKENEDQEPVVYGGEQVEINPSTCEISADACTFECKVEGVHLFLPHLCSVWEFDYTEDWTTKPVTSKDLKMWGRVNYSTNGNYPGVCSNTENAEEIITDGESFKQSATIQIPKNTTGKKRCFYLAFSQMDEFGFVRILQHEK